MTDVSTRASNPAVEKALSAVPNLVKLSYRLMRDPRVPQKQKMFLGAALAYVVAPVDLIPDFIPFVGRADDLLMLAFALNAMFEAAGEVIVHEHWDGTGYPDGLTGEDIPLGGRIICAAEIYDALTAARPYQERLEPEAAVERMRMLAGAVIDPAVMDAFASSVTRRQQLVFIGEEEVLDLADSPPPPEPPEA